MSAVSFLCTNVYIYEGVSCILISSGHASCVAKTESGLFATLIVGQTCMHGDTALVPLDVLKHIAVLQQYAVVQCSDYSQWCVSKKGRGDRGADCEPGCHSYGECIVHATWHVPELLLQLCN